MILWTVFGALLGPLALVLLLMAPPGRCRYCDARVHGWSTTCTRCGQDVRGPSRRAGPDAGDGRLISVVPTQRVVSTEAPVLHPFVMATAVGQGSPIVEAGPIGTSASAAPIADEIAASEIASPAISAPAVATGTVAAAADPAPKAASKTTTKNAPKTSTAAASAAKRGRKKATPAESEAAEASVPQPVGGGVYYSGTAPLTAGSRYSLRLLGPNLQVLGPHDRDPRRVAFERSVTGADADVTDDRLVISLGDGRNTTLLVFVAVEGGKPAALAQRIRDAALATGSRP